jgi:hypothetical protein
MFSICGVITPLLNCPWWFNRPANSAIKTCQAQAQQQQGVEMPSQSAMSERTVQPAQAHSHGKSPEYMLKTEGN